MDHIDGHRLNFEWAFLKFSSDFWKIRKVFTIEFRLYTFPSVISTRRIHLNLKEKYFFLSTQLAAPTHPTMIHTSVRRFRGWSDETRALKVSTLLLSPRGEHKSYARNCQSGCGKRDFRLQKFSPRFSPVILAQNTSAVINTFFANVYLTFAEKA